MAIQVNTTFYIKQGDLLPVLRAVMKDEETGAIQNLTTASAEFHMRNPNTGAVLINQPATIVGDPVAGVVEYAWQAGDTGPFNEAGEPLGAEEVAVDMEFEGEIQLTFAGKPLTVPNKKHFRIVMAAEIA